MGAEINEGRSALFPRKHNTIYMLSKLTMSLDEKMKTPKLSRIVCGSGWRDKSQYMFRS